MILYPDQQDSNYHYQYQLQIKAIQYIIWYSFGLRMEIQNGTEDYIHTAYMMIIEAP